MKHVILYVPGLGDHHNRGQRLVLWLWQLYGIRSEVVLMEWHTADAFEAKLARLLQRIDELSGQDHTVSLVGVSAGASVVVNAYALRQSTVHRVICICGKLRHPETISPYTYLSNPAFRESMAQLDSSLQALDDQKRSRILSIRPMSDVTVPPPDTIIDGAQSKIIPTTGHAVSIAAAIIFYSRSIVGFAKKS